MGRGLSADEKRTKLLEIFRESKDIFQLKELEKCAPKLKGIVQQSVKEVLQSLVDDGMVQFDKIGSANFFWSFPSQGGQILKGKIAQAKEQLAALDSEIAQNNASIERERSARVESATRTTELAEYTALQLEVNTLQKELAAYGRCDPVRVEEKRVAVGTAKEAVGRWTDNVTMAMSYLKQQATHCTDEELRGHFGIEETWEDYA